MEETMERKNRIVRAGSLCLILATFASSTFSPLAHASSCSPVDLRAELGAPRDQGNTGWCFSHTAADLISHKMRIRVSAFDLAVQFAATELQALKRSPSPAVREYLRAHPEIGPIIEEARIADRDTLLPENILTEDGLYSHGGIEDGALLVANHQGLCLDRHFRDGEKGFEAHLKEINAWVRGKGVATGATSRSDIPEKSRPIFSKVMGWLNQRCQTRTELSHALLPDSLYIARSLKDFYAKQEAGSFPAQRLQKQLVARVNRALDERRAVAVGYSAFDITEQAEDETLLDGDHSSIIAARREVKGRCEYFVRNSWGASCELYLKPFHSRCEKRHGGAWVQLEDLKTLYSVVSYR